MAEGPEEAALTDACNPRPALKGLGACFRSSTSILHKPCAALGGNKSLLCCCCCVCLPSLTQIPPFSCSCRVDAVSTPFSPLSIFLPRPASSPTLACSCRASYCFLLCCFCFPVLLCAALFGAAVCCSVLRFVVLYCVCVAVVLLCVLLLCCPVLCSVLCSVLCGEPCSGLCSVVCFGSISVEKGWPVIGASPETSTPLMVLGASWGPPPAKKLQK